MNDEWKIHLEGSRHNLYRDTVRIFSDKAEANHEAIRQYSFPFRQDFERNIKALKPIAPPTRLVIRNFFPNYLVLYFKRLCM